MRNNRLLSVITFVLWLCATHFSLAQRGKDGNRTVSTANTVVNEYTLLNTDAVSGVSSINVAASGLNTNNRFTGSLAPGDLIFLIQLQGATIFSDGPFNAGQGDFAIPKDSSWGAITDYNNCGHHEFAEVLSVPNNNTINLSCGLKNNYSASGKVMVVRVPRFESFTISSTGSVTCDLYTGNSGGIVAIEVKGQTIIDGSINASEKGFRGGVAVDPPLTIFGTDDTAFDNISYGGEKGEGVAGFYNEYDNIPDLAGRYSRGAAGNAGGGGNALNAGGGGGGNGGNINSYTGKGNPSLSGTNWSNAWNLEWVGFANSSSSGGGRGGYSAAVNNRDALIIGPGNGQWGGDSRSNVGGFGGRPLDYSTDKIFMGGGGGAGQGDDDDAGSGGRAGGMVYLLLYDNLGGAGNIQSNGAAGGNAQGGFFGVTGRDGAGGGGAGGTIIIESSGLISGVTTSANGGNGGNQVLFVLGGSPEAQGPGGGGGGGHVSASAPVTASVNGGANGTSNSSYVSEFTPNGATAGGSGNNLGNQPFFDIDAADVSVCINSSATLTAILEGTLPSGAVINWYDAAVGGNLLGSGLSFSTAPLSVNTSFYVGICPGSFREEVLVNVSPGVTPAIAGSDFSACPGDVITLSANNPTNGIGAWNVSSGNASISSINDPSASVTIGNGPNITLEWTISAPGCAPSSDQLIITLNPSPTVSSAGVDQIICSNTTTLAANTPNSGTGTWQTLTPGVTVSSVNQANSQASGLQIGSNILVWTIDNGLCAASVDTVIIQVDELPSIPLAGSDQTICSSLAQLNANTPLTGTGTWSIVSGSGSISNINDPQATISGLTTGIITMEWSITNGVCPAISDQLSINVVQAAAPADAGSDQTICAGSANLSGSSPGAGTGTWSIISGGGNISNPNNPSTSITGLTPGTVVLEWSISLPGCPANSDLITIVVDAEPDVASAGFDQNICLGSGGLVTLGGNSPIVGTGNWSLISGSAIINSAADPQTSVGGLSAGVVVLEWTITNGVCNASSDQVILNVVNGPSPAFAGSDTTICESNAGTLNLNAQIPASGIGSWSVIGGTINVNNASDPFSGVGNVGVGAQVLLWSVSVPGCQPSSDTLTIQIDALPSAAIAGTDQSLCINGSGSTSLNALTPAVGSGTWVITSGNAGIQNTNQANSVLNINSAGNILLSWIVSNGVCPADTDQVNINVLTAPGPALAGTDLNVCHDTDLVINLNANIPVSGTGTWSVAGGGAQIQNPLLNNSIVDDLSIGNNILIWTVSLPGCPSASDTLIIFTTEQPSASEAGENQILCTSSGTSTTLSATSPIVGIASWNLISGSGGVSETGNPQSSFDGLIPGTSTLLWIVQNGICPPSVDTVIINVVNNDLNANAGEDVTIFSGESTTLNAQGNGTYSWTPTEFLSCIECQNPIATPMQSTIFYLNVRNDQGCVQTDSVKITVDLKTDWFLPTAFSPNGDGNNEIFYLRGYGVKSFLLQVFDRWGSRVFYSNDLKIGWDGTINGKPAQSGVYQWSLELNFGNESSIQEKGNVTLSR
ncbi:MAG: hypothetical protein RLZZ46_1064 [Bacteroidota bacterium]|jgi:gliding motility-associated-like protein